MGFGHFKRKDYTKDFIEKSARISLKDFIALSIAAFQVFAPIIITIFAAFSIGVILLTKLWIR
ncbi:hypothetical protein [Clostridium oryzae]|uniref:Uncharacterized protein n=1 Tax=Clostridium oryzae TaxID=1450648 RepID=A0A1V4ILK6_9CLOT|nr:hypothetical protein [Clostridium oryzae]OPJ60783.1 hypothetical protein CLORY_26510 [Clostridium oryzae]